MSVPFHDYYATLGVSRGASAEEIRRAYRKLARETHPDVDTTSGAKERFQRLNEAYEVLRDPETRRRYDALGADWREGQPFTPPSDFERPSEFDPAAAGDFSDFFEMLFGGGAHPFAGDGGTTTFTAEEPAFDADARSSRRRARGRRVPPTEAEWTVTLDELVRRAPISVQLSDGHHPARTLHVTLPPGTTEGTRIRLRGQGLPTPDGPSDLWLRVHVAPHERFRLEGHDLVTHVDVEPHVLVLGGDAPLRTLDQRDLTVHVPRHSDSARRLRLRGLGLPRRDGTAGDLLVTLRVHPPANPSPDELRHYEALRELARRRTA